MTAIIPFDVDDEADGQLAALALGELARSRPGFEAAAAALAARLGVSAAFDGFMGLPPPPAPPCKHCGRP